MMGRLLCSPFAGLAVLVLLLYLPGKSEQQDQGPAFCDTMVETLSKCLDDSIATIDDVKLNRFRGDWYLIGTNAQTAFDILRQKGSQCVTHSFGPPVEIRGIKTMRYNSKGLAFGNPLRMLQVMAISQYAATVGNSMRYICQFLVGTEPLTSLIPSLRPVVTAASKLSWFNNLGDQVSAQWTRAVRQVSRNNTLLVSIVNATLTPRIRNLTNELIGPQPSLQNPISLGALQTLGAYASVANAYLTGNSAFKFMINAVVGLADFTAVQVSVKNSVGPLTDDVRLAIGKMSAMAEQIYQCLERTQRWNLALSGGNWPNSTASVFYQQSIFTEMERVQLLTTSMSEQRRIIYTGGYALEQQLINITQGDQTLRELSQAIKTLAQANAPLAIAIRVAYNAAQNIKDNIIGTPPGFGLPTRTNDDGFLFQNPRKGGNFTLQIRGRAFPYNIVALSGPAFRGYNIAFVWGCTSNSDTGFLPQNDFYLLSRTPNVPRRIIGDALLFLRNNGLVLGGHNVFVFTTTDQQRCNPFFTLP